MRLYFPPAAVAGEIGYCCLRSFGSVTLPPPLETSLWLLPPMQERSLAPFLWRVFFFGLAGPAPDTPLTTAVLLKVTCVA